MRIHIITIFPEFFTSPLGCGIMRIAQEKKATDVMMINLRDFVAFLLIVLPL
jgi:tRNA (guanine37-N1)-methyltransferase